MLRATAGDATSFFDAAPAAEMIAPVRRPH
jgi:hypothetical protein